MQNALDGRQQVVCRVLEDESRRPRTECRTRDVLITAGSDQDHLDRRVRTLDLSARIEAGHFWHGEIGDDNVGRESQGGIEQVPAVAGRSDDFAARFEQTPPRRQQADVVICQQNSRSGGVRRLFD